MGSTEPRCQLREDLNAVTVHKGPVSVTGRHLNGCHEIPGDSDQ